MLTSVKRQKDLFMLFPLSTFIFFTTLIIAPILTVSSFDFIPYNSSQMRLILVSYPVALTFVRDADNNLVSMEGVSVEMVKWLSVFDHFTYLDTQIISKHASNRSNSIGSIYFLHQGFADLILVPMIMANPDLLNFVFFTHPWLEDTMVLVIPAPTVQSNISSVSQPFQLTVWICLLASLIVLISVLYFLTTPKVSSFFGRPVDNSLENERLSPICFYVFGLLFTQGGSFPSDRFVSRLVAGTWCLASFVLVQAYCCILTSFLTTPTIVNLVNSPEELASKTDARLIVQRGYIPDIIISSSTDPFYKILAEKINSYPDSRCKELVPDCLEKVASGGHVLINGIGAILDAMYNDFQKTGLCRFSIAKKTLFSRSATFVLPMNSTRKESFNRGILHMREKGLLDTWFNQFQPKPRQCLDKIANKPTGEPTKLTLAGLSGAFLILGVGLLAATISFITEIIQGNTRLFRNKNGPS